MLLAGRWFLALSLLVVALLACNLLGDNGAVGSPQPTQTPITDDGTRPNARVEAPSTAVLNEAIQIKVALNDTIGITQVTLVQEGRVVSSQPFSPPTTNSEILLPYTPKTLGTITLQLVARRGDVESNPVQFSIQVAATQAQAGGDQGVICRGTVAGAESLNMRNGPGTNFDILAKLPRGETLSVVGRNSEATWYKVRRGNGQEGWVNIRYVDALGDCSAAPVQER
jgi:Bacterial SH3 domain